jgi:hypothetical protein
MACNSDLQVTASYDKTAVYPNAVTLTFTVKDTTGMPGGGLPNLQAAISIATGCNLAFSSISPSTGCGSYSGSTWNLNSLFGTSASKDKACSLNFVASPSTTNECLAQITLQNGCTSNSSPNTASTTVSPRVYLGTAMSNSIYIYFHTTIQWSARNPQPGEKWSIYLQRRDPNTGNWGSFRSSRYSIASGNRNLLVANLDTTSYVWRTISSILPTAANVYRVIIESTGSPPGNVVFANGEDQFIINIKPLKV